MPFRMGSPLASHPGDDGLFSVSQAVAVRSSLAALIVTRSRKPFLINLSSRHPHDDPLVGEQPMSQPVFKSARLLFLRALKKTCQGITEIFMVLLLVSLGLMDLSIVHLKMRFQIAQRIDSRAATFTN